MTDDRCPRCRQPYDTADHSFDKTAGRFMCSVGMESDG